MIRRLSLNNESVRSLELGVDDESIKTFDRASQNEFNLWLEMKLLMKIAAPAVVVQFSVLFIFPQTASAVGRTLGTEALAGFSLGSLVGNLTFTSIMTGALTAADILMPRAYGAKDYPLIGVIALRSIFICSILLLIPIFPLCMRMEMIFDKLGQDSNASHLASEWIKVYLIGVPSTLLFRVVQSFLNAQHQPYAMVFSSVLASYIVHPLLLKFLVPLMGENGSALAITMTQWIMIGFLFLYLRFKPIEKTETWPVFSTASICEALSPIPLLEFVSLSIGGVLVLSEWWLWETVCFIVGTFGVVPLVVHSIAYNLVPLLFMPTLGMSIGLTVRMGHVIAYDINKAKLLAFWCMLFTIVFGAILTSGLYLFRLEISMLFTDDPEVLQGCKNIWPKLCCYIFILHIFGINTAILRALGLQWRMAAIIFSFLWIVTLPCIIYFAVHQNGGLDAVWTILPVFYTAMQLFLMFSYLFADWTSIGKHVHDRAHGNKSQKLPRSADETKSLLPSEKVADDIED